MSFPDILIPLSNVITSSAFWLERICRFLRRNQKMVLLARQKKWNEMCFPVLIHLVSFCGALHLKLMTLELMVTTRNPLSWQLVEILEDGDEPIRKTNSCVVTNLMLVVLIYIQFIIHWRHSNFWKARNREQRSGSRVLILVLYKDNSP